MTGMSDFKLSYYPKFMEGQGEAVATDEAVRRRAGRTADFVIGGFDTAVLGAVDDAGLDKGRNVAVDRIPRRARPAARSRGLPAGRRRSLRRNSSQRFGVMIFQRSSTVGERDERALFPARERAQRSGLRIIPIGNADRYRRHRTTSSQKSATSCSSVVNIAGYLSCPKVLVIAFAGFVVEAQHASTINDKGHPVFEGMRCPRPASAAARSRSRRNGLRR